MKPHLTAPTLPVFTTNWTPLQATSVPPWGARAFHPGPAVFAPLRTRDADD